MDACCVSLSHFFTLTVEMKNRPFVASRSDDGWMERCRDAGAVLDSTCIHTYIQTNIRSMKRNHTQNIDSRRKPSLLTSLRVCTCVRIYLQNQKKNQKLILRRLRRSHAPPLMDWMGLDGIGWDWMGLDRVGSDSRQPSRFECTLSGRVRIARLAEAHRWVWMGYGWDMDAICVRMGYGYVFG